MATWKAGGGFRTKLDGTQLDFYKMFDDDLQTYWLGELDEFGIVKSKNNLEITFSNEIWFVRMELVTRPWGRQYIHGTYQNLCLTADDQQIVCTSPTLDVGVGETIILEAGQRKILK